MIEVENNLITSSASNHTSCLTPFPFGRSNKDRENPGNAWNPKVVILVEALHHVDGGEFFLNRHQEVGIS